MNKLNVLMGVMLISGLASCSSDNVYQEAPECLAPSTIGEVIMTAKDFECEAASRTSFNITSSGAEFLWAENDTVGIFPDQGTQVEFPMTNGAGTNSAAFDGGGWGLKSGNTYYAYYPFARKNYLFKNAKTQIPVSYSGQKQTGNGNLDHLGAFDFMSAKGAKPENGSLNFQFDHLGSLVRLTVNHLEQKTLKSVTVNTDANILTLTGYVDITAATPSIVPKTQGKSLEISLSELTTSGEDQSAVIYFMLAPVDLTGHTFSVTVKYIDNTTKTMSLEPKNLLPGKAYSFTAPLIHNRHEYIDMGLSVGWATSNVGASAPEGFGEYFSWGQTSAKDEYTQKDDEDDEYWPGAGSYNKTVLNPSNDAATKNWGGEWRTPTKTEFQELINNSTLTYTSLNSVNGYLVTSKINGNTIFLPNAGFMDYTKLKNGTHYWTSSLDEVDDRDRLFSFAALFYPDDTAEVGSSWAYQGRPVRPVITMQK